MKNNELEGRIGGLQVDIDDSRQKQGNMKGELKKFMDILDGKLDELHEFRQGLSKLGVDNWEKWHRVERVRCQVRRIHYSMSSGQKLCGTYSPKVMSTQKLSASNKHNHVRKRFYLEREGETGRREASVLHQTAPFCTLAFWN